MKESLSYPMMGFAERTGLVGGAPPTRYLWTDAFAVWNFLELERQPRLIAPDECRGGGEQGGIFRDKAGDVMQLVKAKKIRE